MHLCLFKRYTLTIYEVPGPRLSPGAAVGERKTAPVLMGLRGAGEGDVSGQCEKSPHGQCEKSQLRHEGLGGHPERGSDILS